MILINCFLYNNYKHKGFRMSLPLKLLVAGAGVALYGITAAIASYEDDIETEQKAQEKEYTAKQIEKRMKKINSELARLSDIKMLNDRRESTKQLKPITISIDGVDIDELMKTLEIELNSLVEQYRTHRKK